MTTNFYHIQQNNLSGDSCTVSFVLHPEHAIFKGHFPGNPVLPGVCMIQIIKDVFLEAKEINGRLLTVQQAKFLEVIVPSAETRLMLQMHWIETDAGQWLVQADLKNGEKTFCKFKGVFAEAQA